MTAKRNVALVYVNSALPSAPLSLGDLAAYALADEDVRKEADIKIFHLPINVSYEEAARSILDFDPYLVGFSAYSWNFHALKAIARLIKGGRPDVLTVFGGPNVSGEKRTQECLRDYPFIDFIIEGEGEIGFRQLLKTTLASPAPPDAYRSVPNLSYRQEDSLISNPLTERIADLDEIPSPFLANLLNPHAGPVLWETNRGCPYRCAYCYWGNGKQKLYQYSLDRLEEELLWFAKKRVPYFWVADANFGILKRDQAITELFCRIHNEHRKPFRFFGVNWAKNSSEQILGIAETLVNNGIRTAVTVAYQTLTPEAEALSKRKSLSLENGTRILRVATEKHIPVYTDLIWGLPGESLDEFLSGLDRIIDSGIPSVAIYPLELIPGTEFYERKEHFGLEVLVPVEHSQELVLGHPKMSQRDHQKGVMVIHAHHLLHTFKTLHFVRRYLDLAYGVKHSQLCRALLEYLADDADRPLSDGAQLLRQGLARAIALGGKRHGANIDETLDMVSAAFWDHWEGAEEMFGDLLDAFLKSTAPGYTVADRETIRQLLRFNLLVTPKPGWVPTQTYSFSLDAGNYYREVLRHWVFGESLESPPKIVRGTYSYRFTNSWVSRPISNYSGWWRDVETQMCRFEEVQLLEAVPDH